MTSTERNNALRQHCQHHSALKSTTLGLGNLIEDFLNSIDAYTSVSEIEYAPCTSQALIIKLRAFVVRGKRDNYRKRALTLAQKLADYIQADRDKPQPTNLQLLQEIERLKSQVISNSPSEHAELSQATRDRLAEVRCALKFLLKCSDLTMILSLDRIRILKSDLVYLEKRSHLFDATHGLFKSKV